MTLRLTELRRFPVKSCRGESLQSATVESWGLAGDRRWMLVDDSGEAVTVREQRRMLLIHPRHPCRTAGSTSAHLTARTCRSRGRTATSTWT